MKRRRTNLPEIHQVPDGKNNHSHEEYGSARLHHRE